MARLGDHALARELLRSARLAFGPSELVARARCVIAEAEIALVSRDLNWPMAVLQAARATLEAHGDVANAAHAGYLEVRRLLLLGELDVAERMLPAAPASLQLQVAHELVVADIAMRRLKTRDARAALARAAGILHRASIPALMAEVDGALAVLNTPAARLIEADHERLVTLEEVEDLFHSDALIVDCCRHVVRWAGQTISLAGRPVLMALARFLAEAWPRDVPREVLIARAFRLKLADDSHRARLRVEIGRLRRLMGAAAAIKASRRGFILAPLIAQRVVVLARPIEEKHAAVLALLADGESWSTSAIALALATSQRSVQRALEALARADKVQAIGEGRSRRWTTPPLPRFTTMLLLPASLSID